MNAIEGLSITASTLEEQTDDLLTALVCPTGSKDTQSPSPADLKQELENSFLQPSPSFDNVWLNRLQL